MKRIFCVGGPLDGKKVTADELRQPVISRLGTVLDEGGVYGRCGGQYLAYNRAHTSREAPKAIYLYKGLLP